MMIYAWNNCCHEPPWSVQLELEFLRRNPKRRAAARSVFFFPLKNKQKNPFSPCLDGMVLSQTERSPQAKLFMQHQAAGSTQLWQRWGAKPGKPLQCLHDNQHHTDWLCLPVLKEETEKGTEREKKGEKERKKREKGRRKEKKPLELHKAVF